ncbi:MAG TPA: MBL fold metallo-hydrolase [Flavipsychrobacter sp.]|nr:MBL fold metallo-hydrolase [Flavipsychrobacter sp.]
MSLFTAALASGSNGNCYYIANDNEAVLIDAGISCKEIEMRMRALSLSMQKLKAIFISHEHIDHIKGVEVFSRKHQLPVYITPKTLTNSRFKLDANLSVPFVPYQSVEVGALSITAFPKYHDAIDPHSFIVQGNNVNIGVFTDIGECCNHVTTQFAKCHAAFLETNYDEQMLENGRYPYHLKKRISGMHGHLSNTQALELFVTHRTPALQYLFLSHLSKDNNCPTLAHELFSMHSSETEIVVASRYEPTKVYKISGQGVDISKPELLVQSSLF